MTQQLPNQSEDHLNDEYPQHKNRQAESSSKEARRRLFYSGALTVLIVLIASTFPPSLAATFIVLAVLGLFLSVLRYRVRLRAYVNQ